MATPKEIPLDALLSDGRRLQTRHDETSIVVTIVGEPFIGKRSFAYYFVNGTQLSGPPPSIVLDFQTRTLQLDGGKTVKFILVIYLSSIVQEELPRRGGLGGKLCNHAQATVVLYNIADADSYESAKRWIRVARSNKSKHNNVILLVGNQSDRTHDRQVVTEEARNYALSQGCLFTEVSAKTGVGIEAVFRVIDEEVASRQQLRVVTPKQINTVYSGCSIS